MGGSRGKRLGKADSEFVHARQAFLRRKQVVNSPFRGLQMLASHLNELPGLQAELADPDCPGHTREEVKAWEKVVQILSKPLPQAIDRFNAEAKRLPMVLQVELAQDEPHPVLAVHHRRGEQRAKALRLLWWHLFHDRGWSRLKPCHVCGTWFVDLAKNKVTTRCSAACTAKWWSRDRRKASGHNVIPANKKKGGSHVAKKR